MGRWGIDDPLSRTPHLGSAASVVSRTIGRPSMLPWFWVAEIEYLLPRRVTFAPPSNPWAADPRSL